MKREKLVKVTPAIKEQEQAHVAAFQQRLDVNALRWKNLWFLGKAYKPYNDEKFWSVATVHPSSDRYRKGYRFRITDAALRSAQHAVGQLYFVSEERAAIAAFEAQGEGFARRLAEAKERWAQMTLADADARALEEGLIIERSPVGTHKTLLVGVLACKDSRTPTGGFRFYTARYGRKYICRCTCPNRAALERARYVKCMSLNDEERTKSNPNLNPNPNPHPHPNPYPNPDLTLT